MYDIQGDTLAPFLFIIIIDYALRKTTEDHMNTWDLH